ncbi:MAG: DUF4010 domain-containing protein [Chlorobi bacterium]|nr:DUF4010 domain-containing protein [Chlorobiota bacterium]
MPGGSILGIEGLLHCLRHSLLAGAPGITDVDAITLSVSRMSLGGISLSVATAAILIAATVNSLVKIWNGILYRWEATRYKGWGSPFCCFCVWLLL